MRLTLVGTGHVFAIGKSVDEAIRAWRPDVVFVELDAGRLQALEARARGEATPPAGNFIHRKLQKFQEGVASAYGAPLGGEMVAAVHAGRRIGARVMLIDPPAERTVGRALKELTWRERLRIAGQLAWGALSAPVRMVKKDARETVEKEIRKYQDDPTATLAKLAKDYPTLHRIVIDERDAIMASRIRTGMKGARHGVAILGDGHIEGITTRLQDLTPEVVRLQSVRDGRLPRVGDNQEFSFSFVAS